MPIDATQLISSTVGWVGKAVGWDQATVQVFLPDERGRLRVAARHGDHVTSGRLRASRRRLAFESGRPVVVALPQPPGCSLFIYPLVSGRASVGVVEVVARSDMLPERREVLGAVVDQAAAVLHTARQRLETENALHATAVLLRLAAELMRTETRVSAVRTAVELCFEQLCVPVAGLVPDRSGTGWYLAASNGLGPKKRAELRRSTRRISARRPQGDARERLAERFAAIVGCERAEAAQASEAVLVTASALPAYREFLTTAGALLGEALDRVGTVSWAQLRNDNLDLGIAWTAHELRGPLLGARAALAQVIDAGGGAGGGELLQRTREELEQLAGLVDPLLRWSTGSGPLRRRPANLASIVREAVASCALEGAGDRLLIRLPDRLLIRADARQLRGAVGNVVRNALAYSPSGTPVRVSVDTYEGVARVCVKDYGPGIPLAERHLIFDPFARGGAAGHARSGAGLGLFIARRVVEAHGGSIALRSGRTGSTFCIELPAIGEGRSASAS